MVPLAIAFGFGLGWWRASRRGGQTADKWQYAIAHAIGCGLVGFLIALIAARFLFL